MLKDESQCVNAGRPDIVIEMIKSVSNVDKDQTLTYKVCVNGKQLNPSSKEEIDL